MTRAGDEELEDLREVNDNLSEEQTEAVRMLLVLLINIFTHIDHQPLSATTSTKLSNMPDHLLTASHHLLNWKTLSFIFSFTNRFCILLRRRVSVQTK